MPCISELMSDRITTPAEEEQHLGYATCLCQKILPPERNFQGNTNGVFTETKGMEREHWEVRTSRQLGSTGNKWEIWRGWLGHSH